MQNHGAKRPVYNKWYKQGAKRKTQMNKGRGAAFESKFLLQERPRPKGSYHTKAGQNYFHQYFWNGASLDVKMCY